MNFNWNPLFSKYLWELKYKFIYIGLMILITTISCYININSIFYLFSKEFLISSNKFFFSNIVDIFFFYLEFSFFFALLITIPFIILNIFLYFLPSMYVYEVKIFWKIFFLFFCCFILGGVFNYRYIFPNILSFFLNFDFIKNIYFPLFFEAKFDEYFLFVLSFFYKTSFFFQIPTLFYCMIFFNYISLNFFWKKRKFFYLIFLFISALLSPPELFIQGIIFCFFILFFESTIYIIFFFKNLYNK